MLTLYSLNLQKMSVNCKGPSKHRQCKFPFVWMNHTHTTCSSANSPSFYDPDCKLLSQTLEVGSSMATAALPDTEIVDETGKLVTKCFTPSSGDYGW